MDMPNITAAKAATDRSVTLTWKSGAEHTIDLRPILDRFEIFMPLRTDDALFAAVQLGDHGWSVHWTDDMEVSADTLWRLALEQDAARFKAWRVGHGQSQEAAGRALGISTRMVKYYEAGTHPIPRTVMLATIGYDTVSRQHAA